MKMQTCFTFTYGRVPFAVGVIWAFAALSLIAISSPDLAFDQSAALTHGPIVGGVTPTSAVIFSRTDIVAQVKIIYRAESSSIIKTSNPVTTKAADDFTAHIALTNLDAATRYFYDILVDNVPQLNPGAQFTTFPDANSGAVSSFSFAIFSDLADTNYGKPAYAYNSAKNDAPAFVLQIGDFDHRDPGADLTASISNWRTMHQEVIRDSISGAQFDQNIARNFPFFHIWDDHDYGANNRGGYAPWKDKATRAFKEYFPLAPLPNEECGLWHSFRYAQIEVFMLDLRSQREYSGLPDDGNKSMLEMNPRCGSGDLLQKQWLKEGLKSAQEEGIVWKFIVSTSVWNPSSKRRDSWYHFSREQQELVDFINDEVPGEPPRGYKIAGVVLLSGDLHSGGAIDDGTNSHFPDFSIPTTNIGQSVCTRFLTLPSWPYIIPLGCGQWSEGVIDPADDDPVETNPSGYGLITVTYDDVNNVHSVTLAAKAENGDTRMECTFDDPNSPTSHVCAVAQGVAGLK